MIKNSVPPQAYTRDTLVKAIDWIANQPDSLRSQAKTADAVVALYLQSKRRPTEWSSETSVSGEAFKEDLRTLARDLEQFAVPPTQQQHAHQMPLHHQPVPPSFMHPRPLPESPPQIQGGFQWIVDPSSAKRAQLLKERLNLSSESEALRMMVALGFEQFQALLP